jgi:hypothetical protein
MDAPSPPTSPGWYRDPEDPAQLRHYSGRGWDGRRRTMPAWAIGSEDFVWVATSRRDGDPVPDGPVHRAALPASANATGQTMSPVDVRRSAGGARGGAPVGPRRAASLSGGALHWSGGARPARRAAWANPRTSFMVASTLVGLMVVILVATVGLSNRPSTDPSLAQDSTFIRSANIACGEAMGAIRSPPASTQSSAASGSMSPAAVSAANRNLERLATEIKALPIVASAQSPIQGWLDDWNRYATDRQRQADLAATAAGAGADGPGSLSSTVGLDEAAADAFPTAHGLSDCTLAPVASSTAS